MKVVTVLFALLASSPLGAQQVPIDTFRSMVTIHVYKSGLFSGFAHDHTVKAPLASGTLNVEQRTLALTFNAKDMKIADNEGSDSEHQEIEATMKGPKVLDAERFPQISFKSTGTTATSDERYQVTGELSLHGTTRAITVPVMLEKGRYIGSTHLKQTDFGITPVRIAGGTVKVKDEVEMSFEIVPMPPSGPAPAR